MLLEDPDVQALARSDPTALLEELRLPAEFDEVLNAPIVAFDIFALIDGQSNTRPFEPCPSRVNNGPVDSGSDAPGIEAADVQGCCG